MRRLTLALFVATLVLASGCHTPKPTAQEGGTVALPVYPYYTISQDARLLFKVHMTLAKQEFSGLLVVKELAKYEYRSVFTTETGFKVFDFTVRNDGYTVNYGVGALTKKFIANRLAYTIQAMLLRPLQQLPATSVTPKELVFTADKYSYKLSLNGINNVVSQTVRYKGRQKAEATFFSSEEILAIPDSGAVKHIGFPLQATFRLIKQP